MINPNDILSFTRTLGYWGIGLVIFAEMGLFFCFFLPGDSLLFAAGLLCAGGIFDISIMLTVVVTCSVAGYVLAYFFGDKLGHKRIQVWANHEPIEIRGVINHDKPTFATLPVIAATIVNYFHFNKSRCEKRFPK